MTYKSIKLLALAVICGCSLLGMAVTGREAIMLLMLAVAAVTGAWFILYWFWFEDKRNR